MKIDISSIINKFAGLDNAGEKPSKIDTYLEYYKLGEYLSGYRYTEELPSYNKLKKREKNLLQKAYQEAKKYINECFSKKDNCIQITSSNAKEYAQIYRKLSFEDESSASQDYDLLAKALYEYCKNNRYDMSGLAYNDCDYNFIISEIAKRDKTETEMREKGQVVLDRIKTPYDNDILKNVVEKRIKEENIQTLNPTKYTSDVGNGQYDKPATQKTDLCWAHAGIKTLSLTEKGRIFLESNKYYDPQTGVFGIHLQEAEDNGLHGGIYVITPEELEAEGKNLSEGEGDVTVWMVALNRYFQEMRQNPELMQKADDKKQMIRDIHSGNAQFRFFEIITGAQASRQQLFNDTRLQVGVSYGKNDITFEDIKDLVSNQKGAAIICIGGHAMSVVGIKDNKLLIQESNNSTSFGEEIYDSENNHILFIKTDDINGNPTYELTEYDFEHYNFGEGVIKWE